jgi:CHAP domain
MLSTSYFETNRYLYSRNKTMRHFKLLSKLGTAAVVGLSIAQIAIMSSISPAQAQRACQCVGFVQNYFSIYIPVWAAKDAVGALPRMGYRQVGVRNGAIAVFQPSHGSVDKTYGHIGVVVGSSNGYVTIRSANQWSNRLFSQAGCSNVSDVSFRINNGVTFWAK